MISNVIDFEKAVIGAIMVEKTAINRITIEPKHLFDQSNREILEAIMELAEENKPVDILSVNDKTGGRYQKQIMEMTAKVSSAAHIEFHCATIIEKYVMRELAYICQSTQMKLMSDENDVFEIISQLNNSIDGFAISYKRDFKNLKELSKESIKKMEAIQKNPKAIIGLDTGFKDMNFISHGLHPQDLIIVAARPATGKTAFALNIAVNVATQGHGVAFFSLEMSAEQLMSRVMSKMTGIYSKYITKATIDDYGWNRIIETDFNRPLYIDDTPSLNIMDFKEKARRAVKKWDIKLIVVDYLQLMTVYGKGSREQEISTISRTLKAMAKELNIPILALAQFSRDVEKSQREPRLSDLRESGAIEQDADIVISLHNMTPEIEDIPLIKVNYLKHRNGEVGYIELLFEKSKLTFKDNG